MASFEINAPRGWVVVGRLYDAEHPELLNSLMIELTHPDNNILIHAGWQPEEDPSGHYVVGVMNGCKVEIDGIAAKSRQHLESMIHVLAESYSPIKAAWVKECSPSLEYSEHAEPTVDDVDSDRYGAPQLA